MVVITNTSQHGLLLLLASRCGNGRIRHREYDVSYHGILEQDDGATPVEKAARVWQGVIAHTTKGCWSYGRLNTLFCHYFNYVMFERRHVSNKCRQVTPITVI